MSSSVIVCARHEDWNKWRLILGLGEYRVPKYLDEVCQEIASGELDWFEYKQGNIVYRFMREVDLSVAIKYGAMKFVSPYKR